MQPLNDRKRVARVGVAARAACSRRSRDSDGSVGSDVSGRSAVRYKDVEAAASAVVVRRVGEE